MGTTLILNIFEFDKIIDFFSESKPARIAVEDVNCTLLSVEIFDRIYEKGIVRESGSIRGCLDEYYEDIVISDELRKVFTYRLQLI